MMCNEQCVNQNVEQLLMNHIKPMKGKTKVNTDIIQCNFNVLDKQAKYWKYCQKFSVFVHRFVSYNTSTNVLRIPSDDTGIMFNGVSLLSLIFFKQI
jgi:hypothetical protein